MPSDQDGRQCELGSHRAAEVIGDVIWSHRRVDEVACGASRSCGQVAEVVGVVGNKGRSYGRAVARRRREPAGRAVMLDAESHLAAGTS